MSLSDIADELHCDSSNVHNMIANHMKRVAATRSDEEREDILAMENARLDYLLTVIWPQVEYGDLKAVEQVRRITETRVKINHMDKPSSTATTNVLVIGGESDDYVNKLRELTDGD